LLNIKLEEITIPNKILENPEGKWKFNKAFMAEELSNYKIIPVPSTSKIYLKL
jgi:hypothetical protein